MEPWKGGQTQLAPPKKGAAFRLAKQDLRAGFFLVTKGPVVNEDLQKGHELEKQNFGHVGILYDLVQYLYRCSMPTRFPYEFYERFWGHRNDQQLKKTIIYTIDRITMINSSGSSSHNSLNQIV